jgi:hypothetical protein
MYNASVVVGQSVFKAAKNIFFIKTRYANWRVVIFYNAGVATHDRRIGSWAKDYILGETMRLSPLTMNKYEQM